MTEQPTPTPKPNNGGEGAGNQPPVVSPPEGGEGKPGGGTSSPQKTPDASADARVVPTTYNLTLPKDSTLGEGHAKEVATFAKANSLTNGEAQAILEREHDLQASIIEGQREELDEKADSWIEDTKADSEIGGDKFDESVSLAKRVVDKFATPAFRKAMNESRLGDHPEVIRTFRRIGERLKDDSFMVDTNHQPKKERSIEDVFYPSNSEKK